MWFAFGLITLVAAFAASLCARVRASWRGEEERAPDGTVHEFEERRHKRRLVGARVGVAVPDELGFVLRRQGKLDRWFKRIGLAAELEVRDASFDEALYLESDVRAIGALISGDAELRAALLRVFREGPRETIVLNSIRCSRGRLWADLTTRDAEALARARISLVAALERFASRLRSMGSVRELRRDPFVWKAAALLSVSTASAALGLYGMVRALAGRTDILDPWELYGFSAAAGVVLLAAYVLVVLMVLGRSSRTHLVLVEILIVGGFGFSASCFALARELDIEFDSRPAESIEVRGARAAHTTTRRKGRTRHHYHLHLPDWREGEQGETLKLEIDPSDFRRLEGHDTVAIALKPGALGFEWIESISPR